MNKEPVAQTITGRWEMNRDGAWNTDFEVTYTKVR